MDDTITRAPAAPQRRADAPASFFVVGSTRSGTSYLRSLLGLHSKLGGLPGESHFVVRYAKGRHRWESDAGFDTAAFLDDLLGDPKVVRWLLKWKVPLDRIRAELLAEPPADFAEAIRRIFWMYTAREGKAGRGYVEKTPSYVNDLPLLASLFPEARFVHMIRDGRNVALSRLEKGSAPPAEAARYWKERVLTGRAGGAEVGRDRYLEVRYEDLVDDPERALRRICQFASLEYEPGMLAYTRSASAAPAGGGTGPQIFRGPAAGVREWPTQMGADDLLAFEREAGDLLEELGYRRATDGVSISPEVAARLPATTTIARSERLPTRNKDVRKYLREVERLQRRVAKLETKLELERARRRRGPDRRLRRRETRP